MHYKLDKKGVTSYIDDPSFFLSADGKVNSESELLETIRGLFSIVKGDENPRCRFIARYTWLKEKLGIDESKLPELSCPKLVETLAEINPTSAVLVFPSSNISGPASMFGHTLIRINSGFQSDLMSHAVTYAAFANDLNGFVYAFKGTFGYYKGYFSVLPYYEKVKEYDDMEHRDIWEYYLDLSKDEVVKMFYHIWELKDIYSYYYYFDENCSYNLLFLLEAARPSARLTEVLKPWIIPMDTVRAIREAKLIREVKYRPSRATRIKAIASATESRHQDIALNLVNGTINAQAWTEPNMADKDKIKVLDLSAEYLQYMYSRKEIPKDEYQKRFLAILNERSNSKSPDNLAYSIPQPPQPEDGHLSSKFSLGTGYLKSSLFSTINWRATYHDLIDPADGFSEGSQINFFDITGRYYFKEDKLRLQSLYLLDIVSLSPRDRYFHPYSWQVQVGFDRRLLPDGKEPLVFRIKPGFGLAFADNFLGLSYIMPMASIDIGDRLIDDNTLGVGMSAGLLKRVSRFWKANLTAEYLLYGTGKNRSTAKATLAQNFSINNNNSITAQLFRERSFDAYRTGMQLNWNFYF